MLKIPCSRVEPEITRVESLLLKHKAILTAKSELTVYFCNLNVVDCLHFVTFFSVIVEMGLKQSRFHNILEVRTGNQRGSSTDSDVFVILYDSSENATQEILLDEFFKDDFQTGARDTFIINLPDSFKEVRKIELWTKPCALELTSSDWFIETIKFRQRFEEDTITFPVFRWIKPKYHYYFYPWDAFLPQNDPDKTQRADEIEYKCMIYELNYKENFPVTVSKVFKIITSIHLCL